uniref:Uncharacterized protein n=1 Tax=Nelumbo nucifera TaxID=4432 RepID=A0A822XPB7_NELNU|nr:TPA_asm: hypothetical protein HUJ06_022219 [Nelumbo nucifera]
MCCPNQIATLQTIPPNDLTSSTYTYTICYVYVWHYYAAYTIWILLQLLGVAFFSTTETCNLQDMSSWQVTRYTLLVGRGR